MPFAQCYPTRPPRAGKKKSRVEEPENPPIGNRAATPTDQNSLKRPLQLQSTGPTILNIEAAKKKLEEEKKAFNQTLDDTTLNGNHKREQAFDLPQLKQAWKAFAPKVQNNQLGSIIVQDAELVLNGTQLIIRLNNQVLRDTLVRLKPELLKHLRDTLKNDWLEMREEFVAPTEEKKRLYTSGEKYQHLAEQFPLLKELRAKLELELED